MTARKGRDYPGGNGGVVCRNWLVRASNGDRLGSFFTPKSVPGWVSNNSHWEGYCYLRYLSLNLNNQITLKIQNNILHSSVIISYFKYLNL